MIDPSRLRERAVAEVRERAASSRRALARACRSAASAAWSRRPPPSRAAAIALCAAMAAVSAWAILAQATLPGRLPAPLDWAAARTVVERDLRPGDAVALSPPWAERAREVLPAGVPVLAQRRHAGEDLVGVRRVWLLSLPAAPRFTWDAEVELVQRAVRADPPQRLGALEVSRHELAFPTLPLAFLPDRLAGADVRLGDAPCRRDASGAFRCGERAAAVERAVREVGEVPRPCLVATAPAPLGAPLRIEFPPARIGRTLHGHAGPVGPGRAALRIAVELEGEAVGAAEVEAAAYTGFQVDMSRHAGQTRALSLVLTSEDALGTLCLDPIILQ